MLLGPRNDGQIFEQNTSVGMCCFSHEVFVRRVNILSIDIRNSLSYWCDLLNGRDNLNHTGLPITGEQTYKNVLVEDPNNCSLLKKAPMKQEYSITGFHRAPPTYLRRLVEGQYPTFHNRILYRYAWLCCSTSHCVRSGRNSTS